MILGRYLGEEQKEVTPEPDDEVEKTIKSAKSAAPHSNKDSGDEASSSDSDDGKEQEKVLKHLQFPEIEGGSFSANMCPKVLRCLSKRLTKLEAHLAAFPSTMTPIQSQY